jgi:hypothetical protein
MLDATLTSSTRLKTAKSLPKTLPGAVCQQWKRCGRARCKCTSGALHGPYFYRFWRENGRLRKAYVKPADLEAVRAACAKERQLNMTRRILHALGFNDWRRLTALLREGENHE